MASPNRHPLPDDDSSEEEVNSYTELPAYDSDYYGYEWERHMQILWAEFDVAKAELDADLEKERLEKEAVEAREAERARVNQAEADARIAAMEDEEEEDEEEDDD